MSSAVTPPRHPVATVGPDAYARWRATALGAVTEAREHRLVSDLVGDVAGKQVLDIGCGDGLLICALAARGAGAVGTDLDARMLAAARNRASRADVPARFVQGRIERLPFPDAAFDVVVAVTVFCFVTDRTAALTEAVRVLRPGGRLVLGELGRWSVWAAVRRVRGWLGSPTWKTARFSTAADLSLLARSAGISVDMVRGAVYYPPVGWLARVFAPLDRWLGPRTTLGAAFIVLTGTKSGVRYVETPQGPAWTSDN